MFQAFVLVCAVSANIEIDDTNCIILEDSWGPYVTEENCNIRTAQMVDESMNTNINYYISSLLGYPPFLYAKGYCESAPVEPV
jgi:hypothetical protein